MKAKDTVLSAGQMDFFRPLLLHPELPPGIDADLFADATGHPLAAIVEDFRAGRIRGWVVEGCLLIAPEGLDRARAALANPQQTSIPAPDEPLRRARGRRPAQATPKAAVAPPPDTDMMPAPRFAEKVGNLPDTIRAASTPAS